MRLTLAPDARLDIHSRGFWERQRLRSSTFGCVILMQNLTET